MGYQRAQFERRKGRNARVRKGKNTKGTRVHENKRRKAAEQQEFYEPDWEDVDYYSYLTYSKKEN